MPRKPMRDYQCALCMGAGRLYKDSHPFLCPFHKRLFQKKLQELLHLFDEKYDNFLASVITMGENKNQINPVVMNDILTKKLRWQLPLIIQPKPRFNTTQALKRFCREKYNDDPSSKSSKPPKNSASKAAFVLWARQNKLDIAGFKTRAYAGQQLIEDDEDSTTESDQNEKTLKEEKELNKKQQLPVQEKKDTVHFSVLAEENSNKGIPLQSTVISKIPEPTTSTKTESLEDEVIHTLQELRCTPVKSVPRVSQSQLPGVRTL